MRATLLIASLLSFALPVSAQTSSPQSSPTRYVPQHKCIPKSGARITYNDVGVCIKWACPVEKTRYTMCGTWAELPKVPYRVLTIKRAPDPLASLNSAGNRFTIVPLDHPSMAGMPK